MDTDIERAQMERAQMEEECRCSRTCWLSREFKKLNPLLVGAFKDSHGNTKTTHHPSKGHSG